MLRSIYIIIYLIQIVTFRILLNSSSLSIIKMATHKLYIVHNGKNDESRPNTLKLLDLIARNLNVLGNLNVTMKVIMVTDAHIPNYFEELNAKGITKFPAVLIEGTSYSGYTKIYNIYDNAINHALTATENTRPKIETNNDTDNVDDYISNEIAQFQKDQKDGNDTRSEMGEGMTPNQIKKGQQDRRDRSKSSFTPDKTIKSKPNKTRKTSSTKRKQPAPSGKSAEDIMMERMMENV
jgi:hypothetical protein